MGGEYSHKCAEMIIGSAKQFGLEMATTKNVGNWSSQSGATILLVLQQKNFEDHKRWMEL